jgi:hypothetical protein
MQTTREAITREYAERKAEKEANKNWLQEALDGSEYCEYWNTCNLGSRHYGVYDIQVAS